jgi:chromosome segregation ATPase
LNVQEVKQLQREVEKSKSCSSKVDYFEGIKHTLGIVLKQDSKFFGDNDLQDEFLQDQESFEMVNSILLEFSETNQLHVKDIQNCFNDLEELQRKKQSYKKLGIKFKENVNTLEEHLKKKEIQLEEKTKEIDELQSELECKNKELEDMREKKVDFEKQVKEKVEELARKIKEENEKKEKQIQQLKSNILELEKEVEVKDKSIEQEKSKAAQHELDVNELKFKNKVFKDIEKQLIATEKFVKELNLKIEELKIEKESKAENILELKETLSARDSILATVQKSNLILESKLSKSCEEMKKKEKEYIQTLTAYKDSVAVMKQKVNIFFVLISFQPFITEKKSVLYLNRAKI